MLHLDAGSVSLPHSALDRPWGVVAAGVIDSVAGPGEAALGRRTCNHAARPDGREKAQLLVAERIQHRLVLDHNAILAQPYLALPVEYHEGRHQAQAKAGRNRPSRRRVPVQPDDPHCVAKIAFYPIDDGACHQAPRSEIRVHG